MSYSILKKLKKVDEEKSETSYVQNIVYGDNLSAVLIFEQLMQKNGTDNVVLITPRKLLSQNVETTYPRSLRGDINFFVFNKYIEKIDASFSGPSQFFKDLTLKQFGGRSKSEQLLNNEEFYTWPYFEYDFDQVTLKAKDIVENNRTFFKEKMITQIETIESSELIEKKNILLTCSNGEKIYCENLYFARNPFEFYLKFENKAILSNEFIEFCEQAKGPNILSVKLNFNKNITEDFNTLFLPLSYTHEWGHFIGEFEKFKDNFQSATFIHHVDSDHTTEDDVSRKLKLLKKQLFKVYPDAEGHVIEEFISLNEEASSENLDDQKYFQGENEIFTNIHFVGENAPLKIINSDDELAQFPGKCSHITRALASVNQIIQTL
ncbi:MAG: hypothetical protein H6622_01285 [Halobacteriovoraceae bacterium]|nr:hypothetical protein [Halobacteriovoraceae bacterium]